MRVELAPFSSLGPPLELTGACLVTRSESHTTSTAGQIHPSDPRTFKISGVRVPEITESNSKARTVQLVRAFDLEPPTAKKGALLQC